MKFYIAARAKEKELAKKITKKLQKMGHVLVFNWMDYADGGLKSPYDKNDPLPPKVSKESIQAIKGSDVFILFPDVGGTGMYVELGVALAENKKVFVVADKITRPIFMFHPNITHVKSISELIKSL